MGRTGVTNYVLWGLAALVLGLPLFAVPAAALLIGLCALGLTWWTRLWPEGLGVASGLSGALVLAGAVRGGAFDFVAAGLLLVASAVVLRVRLVAHASAE